MTDFDYDHALRLEALRLAVQVRPAGGEEVEAAEAFYAFLTDHHAGDNS